MYTKENSMPARILIGALLFSLILLTFVVYVEYSSEISDKIEEVVVEYLPDMENDLAKL